MTILVLSYMNPNDMTNSLITISLSQICWFSCILRKITIYTSVTLILVRLATVYVHHTRVLLHLASENGCHFFAPRKQRCSLIGAYKVVVLDQNQLYGYQPNTKASSQAILGIRTVRQLSSISPHCPALLYFVYFLRKRAGNRLQNPPNPEAFTGNAVGRSKLVYHKKALAGQHFLVLNFCP